MNHGMTEIELDALKEATNIGAGHAALALSQMLDKKIMIAVTRAEIVPSKEFLDNIVCDKDDGVSGIYLKMLGDVRGVVIFMFKKESALKLSDLLLFKEKGSTKFIDERALSALKECANILTGAFFAVISDMLGLKVFNQAPNYAFDTAKTILYGVCENIFGNCDERLCLATEFIESTCQITGSFAFIPEKKAMDNIIGKLKRG